MSLPNPITITLDGFAVGGTSFYQLNGPHVLDKSYTELRVVFDVIVTGEDQDELADRCNALEEAFRKRLQPGETLTIKLADYVWAYTNGGNAHTVESAISKTGNPETDGGVARSYTVSITAGLAADDPADSGLQQLRVDVELTPSRQHVVTMQGRYTATTAGTALENYQGEADAVAAGYLSLLKPSATFELEDENFQLDRMGAGTSPQPHVCDFTRQYVELLADQALALRDDPQLRDHRITVTQQANFAAPNAESGAVPLRRAVLTYDAAVDITLTQDLQAVYEDKIRPYLVEYFRANFNPTVVAVEDERASFDETANRLAVTLQFVFTGPGDSGILEVSSSLAYREQRTLDYTYLHDANELAAIADRGFLMMERVWNRTAVVAGTASPNWRLARNDSGDMTRSIGGVSGPDTRNGSNVNRSGWNMISNTSQVSPGFIGQPGTDEVITISTIQETVVERYNRAPDEGEVGGF